MLEKENAGKKRVIYPWLKKKQGRAFKCALALIAEERGFSKVESGNQKLNHFFKEVVDEANQIFPTMYRRLKKHYKTKGRIVTRKQFNQIAMSRLSYMFALNEDKTKVEKIAEHPSFSEELSKSLKFCQRLLKSKKTFKEFINENKVKK